MQTFPKKKSGTTIIDIGEKLHLSKSTVSRALTDSEGVSTKTKMLVRRTAKEMHYTINRIAKNLVSDTTKTIGFMIPDISDGFFPKMAIAAEKRLEQSGYSIIYINVQRDMERIFNFLRHAEEYRYEGIFITPDDWNKEFCEKLRSMTIPIISLRRKTPKSLAGIIPYVDSDHFEGIEQGINYLISLGHTKIGYIGFETLVGLERTAAYEKSIKKHNLEKIIVSNDSYQDPMVRIQVGYASSKKLLDINPSVTAFFAGDDQLAIGAMQYLRENGIRVPEDISIMGYDDRDTSQLFCIQLTTVHQQIEEIGDRAGNLMLEMIEGKNKKPKSICVPTRLYIRETTAARKIIFA